MRKTLNKLLTGALALCVSLNLLGLTALAGQAEDEAVLAAQEVFDQAQADYQAAQEEAAQESGYAAALEEYTSAKADDDALADAVAQAEQDLAQAQDDLADAEEAVDTAQQAVEDLEDELDELSSSTEPDPDRLDALEEELAEARLQAEQAEDDLALAQDAVTAAQEALDRAQQERQEFAPTLEEATQALEEAEAQYELLLAQEDTAALRQALDQAALELEEALANQADADAAQEVEELLLALPQDIGYDAISAVLEARDAYEALTQRQQALVSDQALAALEGALEALVPLTTAAVSSSEDFAAAMDNGYLSTIQVEPGDYTSTLTITRSCTVVLKDVSIDQLAEGQSALALDSGVSATLVVDGDCRLVGGLDGDGIRVPEGAQVLIQGAGEDDSLFAAGNDQVVEPIDAPEHCGAGIGSTDQCGHITVRGLSELTVAGYGNHGHGIGGNGTLVLEQVGRIDAQGGHLIQDYQGKEEVTGLVTAYGKHDPEGGAAIGGSSITISDCTVERAVGGSKAAAIGAGFWGGTDILIQDSVLSGVVGGGTSAGIGGARNHKSPVRIHIQDSQVEVTGGVFGAGIGSGYNGNVVGFVEGQNAPLLKTVIEITGSDIHATGGTASAAIGAGYRGHTLDITIDGASTVQAFSGLTGGEKLSTKYENLKDVGAAAIGNGGVGGKTYLPGISSDICIEAGADVIALSDGGKWAVELEADTSASTAFVLQGRFLNGTLMSEALGFNYEDEKVDTLSPNEIMDVSHENTITVGNRTVTLPQEYTCVAVTLDEAGTYAFTHPGFAASSTQYASFLQQTTKETDRSPEPAGQADADYVLSGTGVTYFDYLAFRPAVQPEQPEQPEQPGGGGTGGGDDDGSGGDGPVTIPEEDTPTAQQPDIDLPDEEVPLGQLPETELPDEQPPLAQAPETGDASLVWLLTAALSLAGLAALALTGRKRPER